MAQDPGYRSIPTSFQTAEKVGFSVLLLRMLSPNVPLVARTKSLPSSFTTRDCQDTALRAIAARFAAGMGARRCSSAESRCERAVLWSSDIHHKNQPRLASRPVLVTAVV